MALVSGPRTEILHSHQNIDELGQKPVGRCILRRRSHRRLLPTLRFWRLEPE